MPYNISKMKSLFLRITILSIALILLPMIGVYVIGGDPSKYLEFPPLTRYVEHEPFSLKLFVGLAFIEILIIAPLAAFVIRSYLKFRENHKPAAFYGFPWWGWVGAVFTILFWVLAWTRFEWFALFQKHTFFPLWLSFIVVVNGITYRNTGMSMLTDNTRYFLILFPASAVFWWYFEYLNRFVQNWNYLGAQFSPGAYFLLATMSFSTVLPAVLSVRELILSYPWFRRGFDNLPGLSIQDFRPLGWAMLIIATLTLLMIGAAPNYMFPFLWVAPLLLLLSLKMISGESTIIDRMFQGVWYPAVSAAFAALICGFFWEMWNFYSLSKWEYSIPFVNSYHIFEMPILGYAGYLPFGLECAVAGSMIAEALGLSLNASGPKPQSVK